MELGKTQKQHYKEEVLKYPRKFFVSSQQSLFDELKTQSDSTELVEGPVDGLAVLLIRGASII